MGEAAIEAASPPPAKRSRPSYTTSYVHRARALAAQGHSCKSIAAEIGLSRSTVWRYARGVERAQRPPRPVRHPFYNRKPRWIDDAALARMRAMVAAGDKGEAIAAAFAALASRVTIYRLVRAIRDGRL